MIKAFFHNILDAKSTLAQIVIFRIAKFATPAAVISLSMRSAFEQLSLLLLDVGSQFSASQSLILSVHAFGS